MSRWAYVNGRFVRHGEAAVHIEDRGYQLADGVYEVWAVFGGRLADSLGHFERLERSLDELRIARPMSRKALELVLREAVRRNRVTHGLVYLQVTRGVARRDHAFPDKPPVPAVVITARNTDQAAAAAKAARGVGVITLPENRWGRCDIKTIGLLPNAMAKQAAKEAGCMEAWFVDRDGLVTEGASSNAWIVDADGVLRTRDTSANILRGVTRKSVIALLGEQNIRFEERAFTPDEVKGAREAFITGAGSLVMPVVSIDGEKIGGGSPGPVATRLRALYIQAAQASIT
ncbi:MAG: D-amino-acid transaminase [Caulobacter sp.]|jgi:D-alanine transaminase|nr:D-amino-acid transaminase [Caulobacter sp.]